MLTASGSPDGLKERNSILVIHKLLTGLDVEYSETTVRRYIHRHFPKAVRRETRPGEVMEVDFGHLGLTWDIAARSRRRTWVFSGLLRHSRRLLQGDERRQTRILIRHLIALVFDAVLGTDEDGAVLRHFHAVDHQPVRSVP